MKKIIALFITFCVVFCLVACDDKNNYLANNPTPSVSSTVPTATSDTEPYKTFVSALNCYGTPEECNVKLNISVYNEAELLFSQNNRFKLTRDASVYHNFNSRPHIASAVLSKFPTDALRVREDGSSYAIYDTDTEYRFYLFFHKTLPVFNGYPIVIKKNKLLSYSDFQDIQIGDPIEKLEAIDDVTTLHKRQLLEVWDLPSISFEAYNKSGRAVSSIHYLRDGILKIEYLMPEEPNIIVSNITFYPDFIIKTYDGEMTSHKIVDIDLPVT